MTVKVNESACWLQYHPIPSSDLSKWAANIVIDNESERLVQIALKELRSGLTAMTGTSPDITKLPNSPYSIAIGVIGQSNYIDKAITDQEAEQLLEEGFIIKTIKQDDQKQSIVVAGKSDRGVLYGTFHLLRLFQTNGDVSNLNRVENPRNRIRMLNEWDNMDGSIERGYAGKSIFFKDYKVLTESRRIREYARLIASIGINSIAINNVNVFQKETYLITDKYLDDVKKIVDTFSDYGVKVFLSLNYASPVTLGELDTADPLDPNVREWWKNIAANIYAKIPNFGGFLVKADSENRPGPFSYDRDHADGANMLAEAVAPFGGIVIWRCFVYNHLQDWRDRTTDRARAAYDHFKPLDGRFHENVVLQIKNGPMDFQVREPVSPLFGAMPKTNQLLELQITQEYTGQQRHLCYLVPQWKEVLDFDTYIQGEGSTVQNIVDGSLYGWKHSGIAGVSNTGDDENWTGHTLAQANLYGFGRLAWNPSLSSEQITDEWVKMTFAFNDEVNEKITSMLLQSWRIYENYNAPLGVGWMCYPHHHYGPSPDGYEYTAWGTYHFADRDGVGVDRTVETGSGYTAQYHPKNAEMYNSLDTCPDELLLFFHHVPYTHKLKSGKTVIQHIYDTHFEGYEQAEWLLETWKSLEGKIDQQTFENVLKRFHMQLDNAREWRDIINTYFYRKSGIPDEQGRTIY